jgi:Fe-S cluster assembly protein SufB
LIGFARSTSTNIKYGFETIIESDKAPKGLSEDTVRFISAKKNEPEWMLEWRLEAYRRWLTMEEPTWARVDYPKIDFQDLYYYAAPKPKHDHPARSTRSIRKF